MDKPSSAPPQSPIFDNNLSSTSKLPNEPPVFNPPEDKHKSRLVSILVFLLILVSGVAGYFGYNYNQLKQQPIIDDAQFTQITPSPTPDLTANWKTLILEKIQFKYPPGWKNPEYIQTSFSQSAEIKNSNDTQRVIVLSGLNKGYSKDELSEFINSLIEDGAKKLTLDGSEAAEMKDEQQGSKISTVYVTSQDHTSQYSISLQVSETYLDQEIDTLFSQILSTFKFVDENESLRCLTVEDPCNPKSCDYDEAVCEGLN